MALRLAFWIVRALGWRAGQLLLAPITLYFVVGSPQLRRVSAAYLKRALGRRAGGREVFRHVSTFANVLLDRVFFLGGRSEGYSLDVEGAETLTAILEAGKGCVLLGAHVGSFDLMRAFGRMSPVPVNPVMFRRPGGVFSKLVEAIDPEMTKRIIDIGKPGAMLAVEEAVRRGEVVGFLGDRVPGPHRHMAVRFLGDMAEFPTGPLVLASLVRAPVVLFFGVRTGPRRYKVMFEHFAERIELRRATRGEDTRLWLERYVARLESVCRDHPYNWFNFYDFWKVESKNVLF